MFIFIFFICVIATSHCFDHELEGEIYLDNGILNSLKNLLNLNVRNNVNNPKQDNDGISQPFSKFNDHLGMFGKKNHYNPVTENPGLFKNQLYNENIKESFMGDLFAMKDQFSNGIVRITDIDTLGVYNTTKVQAIVNNTTKIYREQFNSYYNTINQTVPNKDLDREFVILDMIETSNHLLLLAAKTLMRSMHEASITAYNSLSKLENIILEETKQAFTYACEEINVCRYFGGFVDKMADLINEILILNDMPYSRVINDIIKALEGKHWFLRKIMTVDTRNDIQSKLAPWKNNLDHIRELLTTVQTVITQRYKLFITDNPEMKVKTTAVKILLDLIDKVFHDDDEDFFILEIDTTISSIKDWAEGLSRRNINPIVLINRIVEMLNYHWGPNTKEDVKVLIELIVFGTTRNKYVYEELFAKGAYNRRDDENEIHSDSE